MSDKFFLDTNFFIYSFDRNAASKARKATQLIRKALSTQKGIISYRSSRNSLMWLTKVLPALRKFSQPMTVADAGQYLGAVFRPLLGIHSSQALYAEALHLQAKSRLSWYDSLIVGCNPGTLRFPLYRRSPAWSALQKAPGRQSLSLKWRCWWPVEESSLPSKCNRVASVAID